MSRTGRLGESAMERAIEGLLICRDKMIARGVTRSRLIATEACRMAENGAEFLAQVDEVTGLKLEIVDRETEARHAVSGLFFAAPSRSKGRGRLRHWRR